MISIIPLLVLSAIVWRGDFETCDIKQWRDGKAQVVAPDRLLIVTDPVAEGKCALRVEVRQGDDPINSSGNRNELVQMTNEKEGSDYYYRWFTLFPSSYPSENTWQLFTQWHHSGSGGGSPPLEMVVRGDKIELVTNEGGKQYRNYTMPLVKGRWIEFILHVKWSQSRETGVVELWVDENKVYSGKHATIFPNQTNYLKHGLYRNEIIKPVGVVFHDGFIMATALEDVLRLPGPKPPPAPPVEPAPPDAGGDLDDQPVPNEPTPSVADPSGEGPPSSPPLEPGPAPEVADGGLLTAAPEPGGGCSAAGDAPGYVLWAGLLVAMLLVLRSSVKRGSRRA